ncbi:hypothetical protein PROVRUST_07843 [Providencia rustigianii DSM 4541]|uniref:Uncharacterized protein n=1 Tax=Providencia rustigianii DSM 4541 TaxID=500637 RepID=D1P6P1_9GAMM|nr:hypothetical protein PROVRUST_07843 [Providencia rustigianii DSM 4541]
MGYQKVGITSGLSIQQISAEVSKNIQFLSFYPQRFYLKPCAVQKTGKIWVNSSLLTY